MSQSVVWRSMVGYPPLLVFLFLHSLHNILLAFYTLCFWCFGGVAKQFFFSFLLLSLSILECAIVYMSWRTLFIIFRLDFTDYVVYGTQKFCYGNFQTIAPIEVYNIFSSFMTTWCLVHFGVTSCCLPYQDARSRIRQCSSHPDNRLNIDTVMQSLFSRGSPRKQRRGSAPSIRKRGNKICS